MHSYYKDGDEKRYTDNTLRYTYTVLLLIIIGIAYMRAWSYL